jgi:archaetidylinositol phosphate synthase
LLGLFKKKISGYFNILARLFHKVGLSPLGATFLSLFFAIISSLIYYYGTSAITIYIIAPLLLLISGAFDAIDGAIARLYGKVTRFGAFIDSIADRFGEILIYSSLILSNLCSLNWGLVALSLSMMVSYTRARAEGEKVQLQGIGFAERPERLIIIVVASFLRRIDYGIILISILTCITVVHRILYFYRKTLFGKK